MSLYYLACCFELKGYYEILIIYSQLPIYLDATCNGLQHFFNDNEQIS